MTEKKNANATSRIRLASMNGNEAASDTREKRTGRVLAVGRYADDNDIRSGLNNNDLIIGCSGSGKTGGYVIPNIRRCHGSLIITDTKRHLYRTTAKELRSAGYKVYLLDFIEPEQSAGYNPLDYIREKKGPGKESIQYNTKDILSIAKILCPVKNMRDPFWESSAQTVISFLMSFTLEALVPEEHDMISMVDLYRQLCDASGGRKVIEQWCEDNPSTYAAKKYKMFCEIYDADRTWACIQQFVSVALNIFDTREIQNIFRCQKKARINLHKIGQEKTAIFLNVSDTDRYADQMINLFYVQALQTLCQDADHMPAGRLKVPVRFILDDFASNARIEDFDKIISVIRSRNISVSVILQNLTQLNSLYSDAIAATILNNCDHILYLGGQDIETANYVGTRANRTLESVLLMPPNKAYLLEKGKRGELVDKIRPYADREYFDREKEEDRR